MSNVNGNRTREASPAWVTHSYPAGEHPAHPVPEPAPYWAETTAMPSQDAVDALSSKLHQAPKRRRGRAGGALAAVVTVTVTAAVSLGAGYLFGADRTASACEEALAYSDELNVLSEEYSTLVGEMLEAVFSFDEGAVAAAEADGEAFKVRYEDTLAAYESAAEDCRAAGGELW